MDAEFDFTYDVILFTGAAGILGSRHAHALARHSAASRYSTAMPRPRAGLRSQSIASLPSPSRRTWASGLGCRSCGNEIKAAFASATVLVNSAVATMPGFLEPFETFALANWEAMMRQHRPRHAVLPGVRRAHGATRPRQHSQRAIRLQHPRSGPVHLQGVVVRGPGDQHVGGLQ